MPLYEYRCEACGRRFEVIQKFSDPHVDSCRHCGKGPVERLLSTPAIQFKGTGWYITDYAQKGKPGGDTGGDAKDSKDSKDTKDTTASKDSSGAASTPASSEGTKTETKAAAAAASGT